MRMLGIEDDLPVPTDTINHASPSVTFVLMKRTLKTGCIAYVLEIERPRFSKNNISTRRTRPRTAAPKGERKAPGRPRRPREKAANGGINSCSRCHQRGHSIRLCPTGAGSLRTIISLILGDAPKNLDEVVALSGLKRATVNVALCAMRVAGNVRKNSEMWELTGQLTAEPASAGTVPFGGSE